MSPLVDIGVNLTHASFRADVDAVIDRACAAGVTTLVLTGTSEEGSRDAQRLAATRPGTLYSTVGIHPHHARDFTTLAPLRALAAAPGVVAIGECGLDFNRDFSPRPAQEHAFEAQLTLAAELGLPVFLHERDAHARFLAILRAHRPALVGAVVHCFTGTAEALDAYLDLGCAIGVTGWICDERRGRELRALTARIPRDRLMIETDAPFLIPRDLVPRPARNEPAFLPHVLQAVAMVRGAPLETVAAATTANARGFFGLGG